MKAESDYRAQVAYVLSRFTDAALHIPREEAVPKWAATRFNPVLIGEWISLGVWNPDTAAFLWDRNMSPSHVSEDRVLANLVEAACSGHRPADDIVGLFFDEKAKISEEATVRGHSDTIAFALSRFTNEALHGQREEAIERWEKSRFDPILASAWLCVGVWNPSAADELWDKGVGPAHIVEDHIPRELVEAVCVGKQSADDIVELVKTRWYGV